MRVAILAFLAFSALVYWSLIENAPGRITVKHALYGWAVQVCEGRGWRTIIINPKGHVTVKCRGGGVHLYDTSERFSDE